MQRFRVLLAALVTLGGLGLAAPVAASASPAPHANLKLGTYYCPNGPGGASITYQGSLIQSTESLPDGVVKTILSQELFTIYCQPVSGSTTVALQEKTGSGWITVDSARKDFPLTVRGFSLNPAEYVCQGTYNYWRLAIESSGHAADGSPWGPETDFDPVIGGSGGKRINCR